jgi:hypothetical protein
MIPPGFTEFKFEAHGISHRVFLKGNGPAVLVMHELPGMVPECIALAEVIAQAVFRCICLFCSVTLVPARRVGSLLKCVFAGKYFCLQRMVAVRSWVGCALYAIRRGRTAADREWV